MSQAPYNDRVEAAYVQYAKIPAPEISIIADSGKILKPGMKSVFIEDEDNVIIGEFSDETVTDASVVRGSYCSCNSVTVCTCNMVCTCESVCRCVGNCACNQVCSCNNHCSCNTVCTCQSVCSCQSQSSTRTYCSCVPVH